jgi:predicted RNA-binding Zn ribbon-like protein
MAVDAFTLLGDALWLDFVNSARGRIASPPDLFPDFTAFGRWCELQRLDATEAAAFPAVIEFRDRLTELAEALHDGRQPPGAAVAALNEHLARIAGSRQLTRLGGEWRLGFVPSRPLGALEAVARSAAITLAETRVAVRRCAGETCSLFFTDDTPSGSRHWCDASVCGRNANVERRRGLRR